MGDAVDKFLSPGEGAELNCNFSDTIYLEIDDSPYVPIQNFMPQGIFPRNGLVVINDVGQSSTTDYFCGNSTCKKMKYRIQVCLFAIAWCPYISTLLYY